MRIVMTGATGILGRACIKEFTASGHSVVAIVRPESLKKHLFDSSENVETVFADMRNVSEWEPRIGKADAFFHFGWTGTDPAERSEEESQFQNREISRNIFDAAVRLSCKKFFFSGSQAEYGEMTKATAEEAKTNPILSYGKAKLITGKELCLRAEKTGTAFYHLRFFSLYGENDKKRTLISSLVDTLTEDREMKLSSCENLWNFLYASDAARILLSFLTKDIPSGIYNIAGEDTRVLSSFVNEVKEIIGKGSLTFGAYTPKEKPVSLIPDISKLKSVVGEISFTPFREGIREIINHRKNPVDS